MEWLATKDDLCAKAAPPRRALGPVRNTTPPLQQATPTLPDVVVSERRGGGSVSPFGWSRRGCPDFLHPVYFQTPLSCLLPASLLPRSPWKPRAQVTEVPAQPVCRRGLRYCCR